jgi:GTP-binding protein YchF
VNLTLFGYPKTGKTTLFNLLTGARCEVKAYEDGRREPNQRTCHGPDDRLDWIAALYPDKKKIPVSYELIDLAGVSYGEVKNSIYLSALRKADALVHVVRGFIEPNIPHPRGIIRPPDDIHYMEEELVLTDLIQVTTRLEKLEKDLMKAKDPEGIKEKELFLRFRAGLEEGRAIRELPLSRAEHKLVSSFTFLSEKPLLHAVNCDEADTGCLENPEKSFGSSGPGTAVIGFCGKVETEIAELEEEERKVFLAEFGLRELSSGRFYRALPRLLGVISFFTVGKNEVRAWLIPEHSPAGEAAGAIHSDIERGFIRAEVITWQKLLEFGSLQSARDGGAIRLEGKDYIVQDGDVIYFRFAS